MWFCKIEELALGMKIVISLGDVKMGQLSALIQLAKIVFLKLESEKM